MRVRALTTAAWLTGAVLLAHFAAYRLSYADPHTRAHALASSGHGWTGMLPVLLVAGLLGGALGTIVTALRERSTRRTGTLTETLILGVGGSLLYVFIELGERFVHHGNLDGVVHDVAGGGYLPILVGVVFLLVTAPLFVLVRRSIAALASRTPTLEPVQALNHIAYEGRHLPAPFSGFEPTRGPPAAALG